MAETKLTRWRKLDNAAKIFPATSGKKDTRVFRFSCDLKETIQGEILQEALDKTIEAYPMFCSVMRKGFFWFYLEKSPLRPVVKEESKLPCSNIYVRDKKSLLFEVTYFKNRINFEVFHALTDGTGAMQFTRELVKNYILAAHKEDFTEEVPLDTQDLTDADMEDDSFFKYYSKTKSDEKSDKKQKSVHSYQLRGLKSDYENMHITEGMVSVKQLLEKSREYGVSMTVFLTAVYLCAIHREMSPRQEKYPVVLMIPVNLRKFFPSQSMLNFFSWIDAGYQFETGVTTFTDVVNHVKEFFKMELTKERVAGRMNEYMNLEQNPFLRVAPLTLKNLCLLAGAKFTSKNVTAIFSNMGVVDMPEVYRPYIKWFHVFTSTPKTELCMCSFEDHVVLSFTSRFESENVQRNFFRILNEQGIEVELLKDKYPEKRKPVYPGMQFFKLFTFLCLAAVVVCVMANVIITPDRIWSLFVGGAMLCMWLALAVGFYKRRNLLKNAMWQLLLIIACCLAWDAFTGWNRWSIDYVLPGISLLTTISILTISKVQQLSPPEYMIYYVMSAGVGIVPFLLLLTGCVSVHYPSVICSGLSFLFIAALVIFKWKDFMVELHKKFHF